MLSLRALLRVENDSKSPVSYDPRRWGVKGRSVRVFGSVVYSNCFTLRLTLHRVCFSLNLLFMICTLLGLDME